MSEIKLRAKRKNTDDWLLFGITELFHGENGYFQVCVEDVGLLAIDPATIQPADDPRNGIRERAILDIVQSMAEESLSPDNFEGLILALEELKQNRSIDSNYVSDDPRKAMLEEIRARIYQEFDSCEHHFVHEAMEFILDEMEAKL